MLKILLANPRGFCAGVNMAIDCVDRVLELRGPPVYVFHEIVHNKHVVEDFQRRGVVFVESIGDVPEGAVVVYSAHGIAPEDALRSANLKFERRFRAMEALARNRGQDFASLNLDEQEALWQAVKASEAGKTA